MKKIIQEEKSVIVCDRCGREQQPENCEGGTRMTVRFEVTEMWCGNKKYLGKKELCNVCQGAFASFMLMNHKSYPN